MKTEALNWTIKAQADSTHIIDDGGMIYWVSAPTMTNDEIAEAFRLNYDGRLGNYDVTNMATGEQSEYATISPVLYSYKTGKAIRNATPEELQASIEASQHDGGAGVIMVDGQSCFVLE